MSIILGYGLAAFILGLLAKGTWYWLFGVIPLGWLLAKYHKSFHLIPFFALALIGYLIMPITKTISDSSYSGTVKVTAIYETYLYLKDDAGNRFITYENYCGTSKCTMEVKGKLVEMDAQGTPLVSDYRDYLLKLGIRYILFIDEYKIVKAPLNYRELIIEKCTGNLMAPVARFIRLLVFGDRRESGDFYDQLKSLSILQLFVISGFHFNLLYFVLHKTLGRWIKNDYFYLIILFPYLFLLDFSIPALRAFIMLFLRCTNKRYLNNRLDDYGILFLAAFGCLSVNPRNLFSYSFIMTFLINLNLFILAKRHLKHKIHKVYLVPLLTYLGFVPLLLNLNYELNPLAALYNSFYSILIPPFYIISILVCFINSLEVLFLPLVLAFNSLIDWTMSHTIVLIMGKPSWLFNAIYFIAYYGLLINYGMGRLRRGLLASGYLLLLLLFKYYEPYLYDDPQVTYLNVNQGDCALISFPYNRYNVLIDTGGSIHTDYAKNRIIPYLKARGIKYLDCVIVSHEDSDHCGALESLVSSYQVNEVVHGNAWSLLSFGEYKIYNLNQRVYNNDNDNSSVAYFELMDYHFLFMGDASSAVETQLVKDYPELEVDIIKLGHHGAKTSSSYAFLEQYRPQLAIISVGRNNGYGHPHLETLANLHYLQIDSLRTDYDGTIVIETIPSWLLQLKTHYLAG